MLPRKFSSFEKATAGLKFGISPFVCVEQDLFQTGYRIVDIYANSAIFYNLNRVTTYYLSKGRQ